ncbi:hypothetical protein VTL71DRAFT_4341 [Oculimacula yallundae]|uniref:Uncharacterized protein n=1 Tax=Oculimacula yallundae TaxID=86028 RepID=A0ABR4C1S1_9HELO
MAKTLYMNSGALIDTSVDPSKKAARDLLPRGAYDSDTCRASSFYSHPEQYATTGDCGVIRDWAFTQNTNWSIWTNTGDTYGL